jgi:hypothetical protein
VAAFATATTTKLNGVGIIKRRLANIGPLTAGHLMRRRKEQRPVHLEPFLAKQSNSGWGD